MTDPFFSQVVRRCTEICAVLLLCLSGPVVAKMPELGGAKKFDLICRGQEELILRPYIPVPMAGPGGEFPRIEAVRKRLMVDMVSMQFLTAGGYHPMKIPLEKDGILYLYNQPGFRRWTINLDTYRSIFVMEDYDGRLSVEKMQCRPAMFSGFPFVPDSPKQVREMMRKK